MQRLSIAAFSYALILLSAFVMTGWWLRIPWIVQIHPSFAPMQFNTALCFFLSGIILVSTPFPRLRTWSIITAGVLCAVAGLTLLEYATGWNLGIDNWAVTPFVPTEAIFPGRMALETAFCHFLAGVALLWLLRNPHANERTALSPFAGGTIVSLGILNLVLYAAGLTSPDYGWGSYSRMALHTAIAFILQGSAILVVVWKKTPLDVSGLPRWLPKAIGVGAAILTLTLWQSLRTSETLKLTHYTATHTDYIQQSLENHAALSLSILQNAARHWQNRQHFTRDEWRMEASEILTGGYGVQWISWMPRETGDPWSESTELYKSGTSGQRGEPASIPPEFLVSDISRANGIVRSVQDGVYITIPVTDRDIVQGAVASYIHFPSFAANALPKMESAAIVCDFSLLDGTQPVYSCRQSPEQTDSFPSVERTVSLFGKELQLRGWLGPDNRRGLISPASLIMLIVGLLLTIILVLGSYLTHLMATSSQDLRDIKYALDKAVIVTFTDAAGKITYANEAFCNASGYRAEELLGNTHRILKSGIHNDDFYKNLWVTISSGQIWTGEICNRRHNGELYWVDTNIVPLLDIDGHPYQYIAIRKDVTARKNAEEKLEQLAASLEDQIKIRTQELSRLADNLYANNRALIQRQLELDRAQAIAHIGSWHQSTQTEAVTYSQEALAILASDPVSQSTTLNTLLAAIHPDDLPDFRKELEHAIAKSVPMATVTRIVGTNGRVRHISVEGLPALDSQGTAIGFDGTIMDITERIRAEELLTYERDKARMYLDSAGMIVVALDRHGKVTLVNKRGETLLGRPAAEIIGKNWFEEFIPVKHRATLRDKFDCILAGSQWQGLPEETPVLTKTGEELLISWDESLIRGGRDHTSGVLLSGVDITLQKRAELLLREYADELARSNHELEQFAYIASHDLQEPLRMVASYTELLGRRYGDKLDRDAKEFIDYAIEGAKRMQSLILDLLAYSRVRTQSVPITPTPLLKTLEGAIFNLKFTIEESGAVITHDKLPTLSVNASQISQLFQNLLGNAIKFRSKETPHVHIHAEQEGGHWHFSVTDNGIGIDPKYKDRIFIIFQRLHARKDYPGTGIGLAICKKIVERHGGHIWVESEQGKGATFHFTLSSNIAHIHERERIHDIERAGHLAS